MGRIVDRDAKFEREVWERDEAIKFFEARGEKFKAELIRDLPGTETITLYKQGTGSTCAGARTSPRRAMSARRSN